MINVGDHEYIGGDSVQWRAIVSSVEMLSKLEGLWAAFLLGVGHAPIE